MFVLFFSSRRRHTRWPRDWSSDVCSSDLFVEGGNIFGFAGNGNGLAKLSDRPQFFYSRRIGQPPQGEVTSDGQFEIGRASCRERVEVWVGGAGGERREKRRGRLVIGGRVC